MSALIPVPTELFGLHCADVQPAIIGRVAEVIVLKLDDNVVVEGTAQEIKEMAVRMSLAVREVTRTPTLERGLVL